MRRSIALLGFALLLGSCTAQGTLSSDEVLKRASLAAQQLSSARFELSGNFATGPKERSTLEGSFRIPGVLQDQGQAFQLGVDLQGTTLQGEANVSYNLQGDLLSLLHVESYLRLRSLSFDPPNSPLEAQLRLLQGVWWKIPSTAFEGSSGVTADPRMLRMQSEVLTVTKDRGIEEIRGRDAYRYDVSLDREKLVTFLKSVYAERGEEFDEDAMRVSFGGITATGEVWIDAETFVLHRIEWDIETTPEGQGSSLTAHFTVDFTDHNAAPAIEFPNDAQALSPAFFLPLQEQLP